MTAGFIRRYTADPGDEELLAIEGLVIIDREPPGLTIGSGSGTALCVAEFEDGAFETPIELLGTSDFLTALGGFGFTYDTLQSQHPCARSRVADAAVVPEYWNGNGFVAVANKLFQRLVCVRVDMSVGSVTFTRLAAAVSASASFTFDLEPAHVLGMKLDGAAAVAATFTAAAALINSVAGTYPSTFAGGENITYQVDDTVYTTYFLAADQTQAQVIARLNATVGFAAFSLQGAAVTRLTGRKRGLAGNVRIIAVSAAIVTTATGFTPAAVVAGTGNVQNIDQVTQAEVATIVQAAVAGTRVDRDTSGFLRVSNTATPGTGTIEIDAATTTALGLGFATGVVTTAAAGLDGTIPAGTRIQTVGAVVFVTMQTIQVTAANPGPYAVKVRHAIDDGTGLSSLVATLTTMTGPVQSGSFSVTNLLPIAAALTEAAIDAKYVTAIGKTKGTSTVAREVNLMWSARQSNAVRNALRQNAPEASQGGCRGRIAFVSPPLGTTTRAQARSTSAQPGVGAYRNQRVVYSYPGVTTYIPQIAILGLSGGAGFTVDGVIDAHFDGFEASVCSRLPPEENPGQETDYLAGALSIEKGNPDVQALDIADYRAFRAAGISAPRFNGKACIQSGVNSVDPVANRNVKNINRQRMADFIGDSLAESLMPYDKKLATIDRRSQVMGQTDGFLHGLLSPDDQSRQRIDSYSLDGKKGNTDQSIAAGLYRIKGKVKTLSSMDVIVLDLQVGETVVIDVQ